MESSFLILIEVDHFGKRLSVTFAVLAHHMR